MQCLTQMMKLQQLKSSSQKLRKEIEKIIQNYENKLKED